MTRQEISDEVAREGRRAFLEEPILQYAAKAMLIDLGTFANRLPAEFRLNRPDFRSVLQARMEHDEQEVFAGDA